jgi:hypothetical protein
LNAINVPIVKITGRGKSMVVTPISDFVLSVQKAIDITTAIVVVRSSLILLCFVNVVVILSSP